MHLSTLSEWLSWIASIHFSEMELGLERVKKVAAKLNLLAPQIPVIIVGGTNGKGSTVAGLSAIYRAAGYNVGAFTSPILFKHNEYVRINGIEAKDHEFCEAFATIENARGDISLTPFEFHTLAALIIFQHHPLDVMILEVGLGGRLDAVNIIDADVAIVTSIGIDHVEWLGSTRDAIAREKAGIFRKNKPALCGDFDPPATLIACAKETGAPFFCQGKAFHYQEMKSDWSWHFQNTHYDHLPFSMLATQNMSTVLAAITLMQQRLSVSRDAIDKGLTNVKLTGRLQVIEGTVMEIYDVSHNPDSVAWLAKRLRDLPCSGKTHAVFSMLADKDILQSLRIIQPHIDDWYIAALATKRAATLESLQHIFKQLHIEHTAFTSIHEAYEYARQQAQPGDRIVVFGSFHTLAEVMK